MIFRSGGGRFRASSATEAVLHAAVQAFGRQPDEVVGALVTIEGTVFVHDPDGDPPFVVRPECDRCGTNDLGQFPLEERDLLGARVRGQAKATCRDCRLYELVAPRR